MSYSTCTSAHPENNSVNDSVYQCLTGPDVEKMAKILQHCKLQLNEHSLDKTQKVGSDKNLKNNNKKKASTSDIEDNIMTSADKLKCCGKTKNTDSLEQLENDTETKNLEVAEDEHCKCEKCRKSFRSKRKLNNHTCPYCVTCKKMYSTAQKFRHHVPSCCKRFKKELPPGYNLNVNKKNPSTYQCEKCRRLFSTNERMISHACPYCAACKKAYSTYQKYKQHLKTCCEKNRAHTRKKTANIDPTDMLNLVWDEED